MNQKCKSLFYSFDLIGINPHLFIYNKRRYDSIFSSFLSILILSFSLIYAVYSLFLFFNFGNPNISYLKDNDQFTNRTILIKDLFLIFQLFETSTGKPIKKPDITFEALYRINYFNGTIIEMPIELETCELGKNVDAKYENISIDLKKAGRELNQFDCISLKYGYLPIFHHPQEGYSSIYVFPIIDKNSIYSPEQLQSVIGSEIDIINHGIKNEPFKEIYWFQITNNFCSSEFTIINYNLQFIKYESDEGLFNKNSKILNGISFSDMTFYKNIREDFNIQKNFEYFNKSRIGVIIFEMNKAYFDYYKRTYQKLQSLLAEIMSVVNLLFEIGRQISFFFLEKRMSKDVISSVIYRDKYKNKRYKPKITNLFKNKEKEIYSDNKILKHEFANKSYTGKYLNKNDINLSKNISINDQIKVENENKNIINKIYFYHYLLSFICCKNKKSKLINFFHTITINNLSIENIFTKFIKLEIIYSLLSNEKEHKLKNIKYKKLKDINKYIFKISNGIEEAKNKIESENR